MNTVLEFVSSVSYTSNGQFCYVSRNAVGTDKSSQKMMTCNCRVGILTGRCPGTASMLHHMTASQESKHLLLKGTFLFRSCVKPSPSPPPSPQTTTPIPITSFTRCLWCQGACVEEAEEARTVATDRDVEGRSLSPPTHFRCVLAAHLFHPPILPPWPFTDRLPRRRDFDL